MHSTSLIKNPFALPPGIILTTVSALLLLTGCLDTSTPQDKWFEENITSKLITDGDTVAVVDVFPGEWTRVCPVMAYDGASRTAAWALDLPPTDIKIVNTNDELASDDQWGFVFIYPPDKAEYLRISGHFFTSGAGCVSRAAASFELVRKQDGARRLRLIKKEVRI